MSSNQSLWREPTAKPSIGKRPPPQSCRGRHRDGLLELPPGAWFAAVRRAALRWFSAHGRDLPWRHTSDPYAVLVSEVMLQQTTVATVAARWQRFLQQFPTIEALARANETEVLRAWEGLGYYRRARQLHATAQRIVAEFDSRLPDDPTVLAALPGLGRYSASAVLCFALGRAVAIVEANTRRLWARLLGFEGAIDSSSAERLFWAAADRIIGRCRNPRLVNWALMDLGAMVCRTQNPQCDRCPLTNHCTARSLGLQHELPRKQRVPAIEQRHEAAVIIRRGRKVLLVRYGRGGRWPGLWDFPRVRLEEIVAARIAPFDHVDMRESAPAGESVASRERYVANHRKRGSVLHKERFCQRTDSGIAPPDAMLLLAQRVQALLARISGRSSSKVDGIEGGAIFIERHLARWNYRVTRFQVVLDCFAGRWTSRRGRSARSAPDGLGAVDLQQTAGSVADHRDEGPSSDDQALSNDGHWGEIPCEIAWAPASHLDDYPLPSTARRLSRLLLKWPLLK